VPDGNIVANAATPPPTAEAMRAALVEKGAKAEDLTALDDAALKAKYDESQKPVADKGVVKPEDFVVKAPEGVEVDQSSAAPRSPTPTGRSASTMTMARSPPSSTCSRRPTRSSTTCW
jgi:hypothetical protein